VIKKYEALVIGGGPSGLGAAIELSRYGIKTLLVDEQEILGGQLVKQTHKFFGSREHYAGVRGIDIPQKLMDEVIKEIDIYKNSTVIGIFQPHRKVVIYKEQKTLEEHYIPYIVIATGASENMILFENNDLPGVFGAGAVQTLMNQFGVIPGDRILMVGAGNIGLIVSYQLMQAGSKVLMVIEAGPKIGGYHVHSSKIARMGVPIKTCTTIVKAIGKERVEGAVIQKVDKNWNPVPGTEEEISVDTICLSVGLSSSYRLALHAGCKTVFIREMGKKFPRNGQVRIIFISHICHKNCKAGTFCNTDATTITEIIIYLRQVNYILTNFYCPFCTSSFTWIAWYFLYTLYNRERSFFNSFFRWKNIIGDIFKFEITSFSYFIIHNLRTTSFA